MRILIAAMAALSCVSASVVAQQPQFKQFDAVDVFRQMDRVSRSNLWSRLGGTPTLLSR